MRRFTLLLGILAAISLDSAAQTWEWRTPRPTGLQIWGISAVSADTLWMADNAGIIRRSYDGGMNWERLYTPIRVPWPLTYFVDATHGWIVGGVANSGQMGLILKTEDSGDSWVQQASNVSHFIRDIDFVDREHGWVLAQSTWNGPYMILGTTNGGTNWDTLVTFQGGSMQGIDFVNQQLGWALRQGLRTDTCQVIVTFDGGLSWHDQYYFEDTFFSDLRFLNESNGWAVSSSGTLHHTTDGGVQWETQRPDSATGGDAKLDFADSLHGWVAFGDYYRKIMSTNDGGQTWSMYRADAGIGLGFVESGDINHVWVGGSYGHILHSENSGTDWTNLSQRLDLGGIVDGVFVDSLRGWLFGSRTVDGVRHDVIWRTDNGTQTWVDQSRGTSDHYVTGDFIDSNVGWIYSNTGVLIRTFNGGAGWEALGSLSSWTVSKIDFWNESHGAAISGNTILITQDGGESWSEFSIADSLGFLDVEFADGENIWAVGHIRFGSWPDSLRELNFRVHSSNGGLDWEVEIFEESDLALVEVEFSSRSQGFLVNAADNSILRTEDEGLHWEPVAVQRGNEIKKLTATSDDNIWGVWNFNEIIQSRDGGLTWQRHPVINTDWIRTLMAVDSSQAWVLTIYNSLFRYGSTVLGIEDGPIQTFPNDFNVSVWPNPFNPTTNVLFDLKRSGHGSIRLYDVTGRLVETLVDDYLLAGRHTFLFNAKGLASGSYFVSMCSVQTSQTRRVVLLR